MIMLYIHTQSSTCDAVRENSAGDGVRESNIYLEQSFRVWLDLTYVRSAREKMQRDCDACDHVREGGAQNDVREDGVCDGVRESGV